MRKELLYFSDLPPLFILVIMENTLREKENSPTPPIKSLNPCFNGRYSQSSIFLIVQSLFMSLNPCFNGRYSQSV